MTVLEEIRDKCDEIMHQTNFVKTLADLAGNATWQTVDTGLTHLKSLATATITNIETLIDELTTLIS